MRESEVTGNCHASFGERDGETRAMRVVKVRAVPTLLSPSLSNLYLDKLDKYIEGELIPAYTRGQERQKNRRYFALMTQAYKRRKQGRLDEADALTKEAQQLPTVDPYDPAYRRLHYLRYADDWLLGFVGPKEEAETIKARLKTFLHET